MGTAGKGNMMLATKTTANQKRCCACGVFKARSAFSAHDRMKDGLHSWCRACKKRARRADDIKQSGRQDRIERMLKLLRRTKAPTMPPAVKKLSAEQYRLLIYVERLKLLAPDVDALAWRFGANGLGRLSDQDCVRARTWVQGRMK